MSGAHRSSATAMFADQSGRRRRVLVIAGALLGTLMLAMAAVLIGGSFSTTQLDAVEWPAGGPDKSVPVATKSSSTASQTSRPITSATRTAPVRASATPTPRRSTTPTPTRTRAAVRPSTSRSATPSSEETTPTPSATAPAATETAHTPPGRTRQPPGQNPDKTQGAKR